MYTVHIVGSVYIRGVVYDCDLKLYLQLAGLHIVIIDRVRPRNIQQESVFCMGVL